MNLVEAKALIVILLAFVRLFSGLVPLCFTKQLKRWTAIDNPNRQRVDITVSLCLSLGGGVLLATCFIHMIPEVRHAIENHSPHSTHHFPFTELLVCIGFFIVYIVEESVRHCLQTRHKTGSKSNHVEVPWTTKSRAEVTPLDSGNNSKPGSGCGGGTPHHGGMGGQDGHPHVHTLPPLGTSSTCEHTSSQHIHSLRSFLVVLALSFHSVMEGLAIGLEQSLSDVWTLFTAVSIHECTILFCVGLEMLITRHTLVSIVTHIVTLALVSPFGVIVGTLVTVNPVLSPELQGLGIAGLQGLAAGTILYVTFFEVLDKERKRDSTPGLIKLAFVILGFCLMICLELLGSHSHSHHDHEDLLPCNNTCNTTLLTP
uniref:Zinc transporter ZIP3 n=1 Tax=Cacopsylla melanoneura TaxID=428564 RepID=A0A8D8SAC9_9HEMI